MIHTQGVEQRVGPLARVRDEELAGLASGPASRALLASVVAEQVEPTLTPRLRRLVLAAAAVVAVTTAAVAGPGLLKDGPGGATSYANSAIDVRREGDYFVARIRDPLADHARYAEAFRAVGKNVEIELVPVSPKWVGDLIEAGADSDGPVEVSTELVGPGSAPVDCASTPGHCTIVIRASAGTSGTVRYKLGRAAQPGETLQDPAPDAGEKPRRIGPANGGGN